MVTIFVSAPTVALSVEGFVVTVSETRIKSGSSFRQPRSVVTLHRFSLEGVSLGSNLTYTPVSCGQMFQFNKLVLKELFAISFLALPRYIQSS